LISNEIHNAIPTTGSAAMTVQTSMLHVRVEDDIKEQATQALTAMGLTVSEAVRLFLRRVVIDQAFPLELKVPNAETKAAMAESRAMMTTRCTRFASADELFADLEKNSSK
jgi:DNA-damage-inducible protein J